MQKAVSVSWVSYLFTFTGDSWAGRCLEGLLVTDGHAVLEKRGAKQGEWGTIRKPLHDWTGGAALSQGTSQ